MSVVLIDISILLNILGFGQGIFLSISLLRTRKERPENTYLIYFILSISIIILNSIFRLSYYMEALALFERISNSFLLVIAPSIFLFVKMKFAQTKVQSIVLHYVPFLLYFIFVMLNLAGFRVQASLFELVSNVAYLTFNIQFLIYFTLSLLVINQASPLSKPLKWIRVAIWLIIFPWILQIGFVFAEELFEIMIPDFFTLNLALIFGVCAFFLSYVHSSERAGFSRKEKYEDSKLSSSELDRNLEIIKSIVEEEQLYLDIHMSLNMLAEKTKLSPRDISLTINQGLQQNFVDFTNSYRIEAFKKLIASESSKNYTMAAIAESCGFQSSSAFYAAFKKQTGITPKQFKDNLESPI